MRNSVIGSNCRIGDNVKLHGVYVWDNVEIGDNCTLSSSIVSNDVKIKSGVHLRRRCLISAFVVLGSGVSLENVTIVNCNEDQSDKKLVGAEGRGIIYSPDSEFEEKNKKLIAWDPDEQEDANVSSDEEVESDSESDHGPGNEEEDVKVFFKELIDNFERGVTEKISCDNLVLEVNSVK